MNDIHKVYLFLIAYLFISVSVMADGFMITQTLRDNDSTNFSFGGNPRAFLTAGVPVDETGDKLVDPVDNGWLRLTKDALYQRGYGYVKKPFPSTLGVQIDLEFKIWRTNPEKQGADGFSVFLFDANTPNFKIGGFGGSLGYAQFDNGSSVESSVGLSNGYVGIGLDEFGNYSNPTEGRLDKDSLDPSYTHSIFNSNSIGVRGPAPEYRWLTGNFKLLQQHNLMLQYDNANITQRPSDKDYYRRIQVEINPGQGVNGDQYAIKARIKTSKGERFKEILDNYILPTLPPAMLKLGFAASTGECINYHELRNLYITTPGGARVIKQVDKRNAKVGDTLTYTVEVYNQTTKFVKGLILKDSIEKMLPYFMRIDTIEFDKNGYTKTGMPTGSYPKNLTNVLLDMEANSMATFTVKGLIKGWPTDSLLSNTAIFKLDNASGYYDKDQTNDTAKVVTWVEYKPITANLDPRSTHPNTAISVDVLNNDTFGDCPFDTASIVVVPGKGPSHGIAVPDNTDGTILYTPEKDFAGIDTFTYQVADIKGKIATALVIITIVDPLKIIDIPNVLTPSLPLDGLNDYFRIKGLESFPNSILRICNRWGDEVYYTKNYDNKWDGNGLNEGTYYYTLILDVRGEKKEFRGWVLLKR